MSLAGIVTLPGPDPGLRLFPPGLALKSGKPDRVVTRPVKIELWNLAHRSEISHSMQLANTVIYPQNTNIGKLPETSGPPTIRLCF